MTTYNEFFLDDGTLSILVDAKTLARVCDFAYARDDRPTIAAVHVKGGLDSITLEATDQYTVARWTLGNERKLRAVEFRRDYGGGGDVTCDWRLDAKRLRKACSGATHVLLQGRAAAGAEAGTVTATSYKFGKRGFGASASTAEHFECNEIGSCRFAQADGCKRYPDVSSIFDKNAKTETTGANVVMPFSANADYILKVAQLAKAFGAPVTFRATDPMKPVYFRAEDTASLAIEKGTLDGLVMPVRTAATDDYDKRRDEAVAAKAETKQAA